MDGICKNLVNNMECNDLNNNIENLRGWRGNTIPGAE